MNTDRIVTEENNYGNMLEIYNVYVMEMHGNS